MKNKFLPAKMKNNRLLLFSVICLIGLALLYLLRQSFTEKTLNPESDLSVVSVSADMGNGEGAGFEVDLPKVNGSDAIQSKPGRIVHWDAEWHYDPAGNVVGNTVLGGHLILLGLSEAYPIRDESTCKILEWGKKQNAISGFVHMQYLNNAPVRASSEDAGFFVSWIDNMIINTSPGGIWNHFFTHDPDVVQARYKKAKDIYLRIAEEAKTLNN
jgi:hypothetical protein